MPNSQTILDDAKFKEEVRLHFDERADRYDHDTASHDQADFANFEAVLPYLIEHAGSSILEVGAGTGIILARLLAAGKDACGLDLSPALLRVAAEQRRIPSSSLIEGDAEVLPFPDNGFASVCVFRSLHHMPQPAAVLAEMARCARDAIFVYDSAGGWRWFAKRTLRRLGLYQTVYRLRYGRPDTGYRPPSEAEGPVRVFYAEEAVAAVEALGLTVVRIIRSRGSLFLHARKP